MAFLGFGCVLGYITHLKTWLLSHALDTLELTQKAAINQFVITDFRGKELFPFSFLYSYNSQN